MQCNSVTGSHLQRITSPTTIWYRCMIPRRSRPSLNAAQVKCLVRVSDWAVKSGNLTGFLITGLSPRGGELIENYVKRSGDVQTAALLGVIAQPKGFADLRGLRWLESYRDLMDTWCMHIQVTLPSPNPERGPSHPAVLIVVFFSTHYLCSAASSMLPSRLPLRPLANLRSSLRHSAFGAAAFATMPSLK